MSTKWNEAPSQFRQGDVIIERVRSVPETAVRLKRSRRIVLAEGEATGHHHCLVANDPADWWKSGDDVQFVSVNAPAKVVHEEHSTIELPAGTYRVRRQREYSPEEVRRVQD